MDIERAKPRRSGTFAGILLAIAFFVAVGPAQTTGKRPVIIIPGITGSQLIDPKTGRTVWFSVKRDKIDDLRLPMTSPVLALDKDGLVAGDIIREIKVPLLPDVEVYQSVIDALVARGYTEAAWNKPKATDVFYVFPYDWRRDNVETAHILLRKIAAVKAALHKPDLKFDVLAHSMGGLVARYAAMYGMADLPRAGVAPVPNWSGAANFNKLMMFGTPNEGSYSALDALIDGYPILGSRKLPLVSNDLPPEAVLTAPSVYELLPHQARFFGQDLKPLDVNLYDPATWITYGWGALSDAKFLSKLKDADKLAATNKDIKPAAPGKDASASDLLLAQTTYAQVQAYFSSALSRAKRFQEALDAPVTKVPIQLFAYGGNCEPTLDGVLLVRNEKKDRWLTILDAHDTKTGDGQEIKKDAIKSILFSLGDGRVTQNSLLAALGPSTGDQAVKGIIPLEASFFACSTHSKLFLEKTIQDSFLSALVVEKQLQP